MNLETSQALAQHYSLAGRDFTHNIFHHNERYRISYSSGRYTVSRWNISNQYWYTLGVYLSFEVAAARILGETVLI